MNRMRQHVGRLRVLWLALTALMCAVLLLSACRKKPEVAKDTTAPFVVNDASKDLLFTWVDAKGDFHVEQSPKDVPLAGRDSVRVVDPSREDGTHGDRIFLADLRVAGSDGNYPVHAATLSDFDALALARRQGKLPTLADDGGTTTVPTASALANNPDTHPNVDIDPSAQPSTHAAVVIYGASWCGPCHQAQAYLRQKNIPFIDKDIEEDPGAAKEMQAKLAKAGMRGGSIPVIDVRGHIMVGFNAQQIDAALGQAL
ncbi:MAG: glutaredoxin domain-containing protein [Polyangiaceae bacterium]